MFWIEELPVPPVVAVSPAKLPVDVLLALPAYTVYPRTVSFNLLGSLVELLRSTGSWEAATRIINVRVWAPGLTEAAFVEFVGNALRDAPLEIPDGVAGSLRASSFLGLSPRGTRESTPLRYDIVHVLGDVGTVDDEPVLLVGRNPVDGLRAGALRDVLVSTDTRLFILHLQEPPFNNPVAPPGSDSVSATFARYIVGGGGPNVVTVASNEPYAIQNYFERLYAGVLHNEPLQVMAVPEPWQDPPNLQVGIFHGRGAQELLRFEQWMETLAGELGRIRDAAKSQLAALENLRNEREQIAPYLHRSRKEQIDATIEEMERRVTDLQKRAAEHEELLVDLRGKQWSHESQSAVPLSKAVSELPEFDSEVHLISGSYPELIKELEADLQEGAASAPRVLNANFVDSTGKVLVPTEGLVEGNEYELLVDVGPRWNRIASIVKGNAEFPEQALPPDEAGYLVDVVVVSQDFTPSLSSAQIWIPRGSGRSYAVIDGKRAERPGPVGLRLRAPERPEGGAGEPFVARARLCLYYETNVLQSAVVEVGVVAAVGQVRDQPNHITVDYVLTGNFQELAERFARRAVRFQPDEPRGQAVALSLTLNDDGAAGHRIVVKGREQPEAATGAEAGGEHCPPHGWTPYDPTAGQDDLANARRALLDCFFERDKNSGEFLLNEREEYIYKLDAQNGKPREQFEWDLFVLAALGSGLRSKVFNQVRLESAVCNQVEWVRSLLRRLAQSSLIQIARTGPAQYAFPWALVYEYPLNSSEQDEWQYCRVVQEEWSEAGIRTGPVRTICKYHNKEWHRKNIICPYGFWGLKHIIEEPLSLHMADDARRIGNAENKIRVNPVRGLAIGVTRDKKLDQERIERHLKALGEMAHIQLAPVQPAEDWKNTRAMLRAPEIVYFLCHGEYDKDTNEDYLSLGPRDGQSAHKIYATQTIEEWKVDPVDGPDTAAWRERRPLVFINGCHTQNLSPGKVVSFATAFAGLGAGGVLGTEVSVELRIAVEVAESLFHKLAPPNPQPLGEALREVRWELANKGNLLGLAYTLYGLADLHLVEAG
ncbi:MAG: CHAT domain-containing protein [Chloroflexota bacterium]|nr:CHAT domain-containing protein [Chloroflexota bacterium]